MVCWGSAAKLKEINELKAKELTTVADLAKLLPAGKQ
jgi:hypothetical protein